MYTKKEIEENLKNHDTPEAQAALDRTLNFPTANPKYPTFAHEFASSQNMNLNSSTLLSDVKMKIRELTAQGNLPEGYDD